MQQDARVTTNLTNTCNIVHHTDLVIGVHHTDQYGVFTQRRLDHVRRGQTSLVGIKVGDVVTFSLQLAASVQDGLVFDFRRDDVLTLLMIEVRNTLDGQVVRLCRARGPDDLTRIRIDELGDLIAGVLNRLFGLPAKNV